MKCYLPAIMFVCLLAGCTDGLDTGYQPRKLGVTPEERRAYYAPQFSPESQAGQQGEENLSRVRRPVNY